MDRACKNASFDTLKVTIKKIGSQTLKFGCRGHLNLIQIKKNQTCSSKTKWYWEITITP